MNRRELIGAGFGSLALATIGRTAEAATAAVPAVAVERGYVRGPYGQVHFRRAAPATDAAASAPPLVLFHQNPKSSRDYEWLMPCLATDRVCVALDTPGYGGSDAPPEPPGIPGYAGALLTALRELDLIGRGRPVDAFGFHTGSLLAAECAVQAPDGFRRLVLAGVPFVVGEERLHAYARVVTHRQPRGDSGDHLARAWKLFVEARPQGFPQARAEAHALDYVAAGERAWWPYAGVYTYPSEEQLPKVRQPTLLIAVGDFLAENTRQVAGVFPAGRLVEAPDLQGPMMLDVHAIRFAALTREFLGDS